MALADVMAITKWSISGSENPPRSVAFGRLFDRSNNHGLCYERMSSMLNAELNFEITRANLAAAARI
jgi:hypothetical protein